MRARNNNHPISVLVIALASVMPTLAWGQAPVTNTYTTSGVYNVPSNITTLTVECWGAGGGGGGGGSTGSFGGGGGGGGGGYAKSILTVIPNQAISFTVGAGGVGGPSQGPGIPGGNSVFQSVTGTGGQGGFPGNGSAGPGAGGAGTGTLVFSGGPGGNGFTGGSSNGGGGGSSAGSISNGNAGQNSVCCGPALGGTAVFEGGAGGTGGFNTIGLQGTVPGGGGGGGSSGTAPTRPGGNGSSGQIRVTYQPPSVLSTIIENTGFPYPGSVAYQSYQHGGANLSVGAPPPSDALAIAQFSIVDGGGASDADTYPTILSGINFTVINPGNLRYLAIQDNVTGNIVASTTAGALTSFSGLSISTIADGGTIPFTVYATFNSTVIDNTHFELQVTNVTAAAGGSTFAFPDGGVGSGGARSSTVATNNKVVVTANQLKFVQQPSNTLLGITMSPSVTIEAKDNSGSRDLDISGSVVVGSTGSISGSPTASLISGFGTVSGITHTSSGASLSLATSNALGLANVTSSTFNISASSTSDIIANTGFAYPSNIAYDTFQEAINITNSATSLVVAKFDIRDGGGSPDADVGPTILSSLQLDLGVNFSAIRRIAIYDAAGTAEIGSDVAVASQLVSFSGLAVSAADNGTTTFSVRVSFRTAVTDNLQFSIKVNGTSTAANLSSTFAAANAGGATSSTVGNNNRIEVSATTLQIGTINSNVLGGVNLNVQQTSPVIRAVDGLANVDLDYASTVSLTPAASISTSSLSSDSPAPNAGTYTFPASFQFTVTGPCTLGATASGVAGTTSNAVTVLPGIPNAPLAVSDNSFAPAWLPWSGTPVATAYLLDVSTASNFSSFVSGYNAANVGNTTATTVSGLAGNTQYYYRIRVVTGSGTSIVSPANVTTTAPAAPTMAASTGVSDVALTANWSASTGATGYRLDVSTNPAFSSFVGVYNNLSVGNVTTIPITGLSPNTTYYIRARASNVNGTSNSPIAATTLTAPQSPVITFGPISNASFNVNWAASPGATNYAIDVSLFIGFSPLLAGYSNQATGNVTTIPVNSGIFANTVYYVRVRATNGSIISGNGSGSVTTAPVPPTMQAATSIDATNFTANWSSSPGATGYALDVSLDNFSSTVTGDSALAVAGTSQVVSGLLPNTTYQYRARALNGPAISANPSSSAVLTWPAAPTTTAGTAISQAGFTINWNAMAGIANFELDVSALSDFSTRLSGFDALVVTGTSKVITGLTAGTTYYYRLRAVNATHASANSSPAISVVTVPPDPVATAASVVSNGGFTANWNATVAATSYFLDVSTASDFSSFIVGYNSKQLTPNSEIISGLSKGTTYYYRVRSSNSSGTSNNSNVVSQATIPDVPVLNTVTIKNANSFFASWNAVPGADSYEIDVSTFASSFGTFVTGYNAKSVPASSSPETLVTPLLPNTAYTFRVRAVNTGGKSASSSSKSMITDAGSGVAAVFTVNVTSNSNAQFSGGASVTGTVANGVGNVTGTFIYKGITETATKTKSFAISNNTFTIPVDETMLDDLGIEYTVSVVDETDAVKTTTADRIYRAFTSTSSPSVVNASFEGTKSSIRIIAIPYDLKDNLIESIFSSLGVYDKRGWRLAHFQQGQGNIEYKEGINKIERGVGYWFNARGTVNVKSGDGNVGVYNQTKPFTMSLVTGWNQIGNPYPFAIDWSDVLADNKTVTGVGNLKIYSGAKANYDNGNKMEPFTGGFVHSDKDVSLSINVALRNTADGGRMTVAQRSFDLGQDSWRLPLNVTQNNSTYSLGGIGMEPRASVDNDPFDEIRLPRTNEYLDVTFDHPESRFRYLTTDVLPTDQKGSWTFSIASDAPDARATIAWDNSGFGNNGAQVWLLDPTAAKMIDMRAENSYVFNNPGEKEMKIYYSKNGDMVLPELILAGPVYPNPTAAGASFSLILPEGKDSHHVDISLIDMMGHPVRKIFAGDKSPGAHTIQWDGQATGGERAASGMYLIKAEVNDNWVSVQKLLVK